MMHRKRPHGPRPDATGPRPVRLAGPARHGWLLAVAVGCGVPLVRAAESRPAEPAFRVVVDPRVELVSIIFRLAGSPEYNHGMIASYVKDVEAHFGKYRNHPAVGLARNLAHTRAVGYDAPMMLAVHITDTVEIREKAPFDPLPEAIDSRWSIASARDFLAKAREFVRDTDFQGFLNKQEAFYAEAVSRLRTLLRREGRLEWFDQFFGTRAQASFTVAIGLLNGGANYGPHCRTADGREELYCILGVWQTDALGRPAFDRDVLPIVIHEFCHSYGNPLVDRHLAALRPVGERVFPHVADILRRQGYGRWDSMMYESIVRACVVRYTLKYGGPAAARKAITEEKASGFAWIEDLSDVLGEYETRRGQHATLDEFMPRIVAVFNRHAAHLEQKAAEVVGDEPRIVAMAPANESTNVDPDLAEIRITFDRPMKDGPWALLGEGPHLPEVIGAPKYDAEHRTLVVPIRLRPLWTYEFSLNSEQSRDIRCEKGVPLPPVRVRFATGERRGWQQE